MRKVSNTIRKKIMADNVFSNELAIELGIQQQSVLGLARRNSPKLTLYQAVLFYKKKGYKEKDIFQSVNSETEKL